MDDQRDYAEEDYNRSEYEREAREEAEYERLENLGLIPEEHDHGQGFTCVDCHDFENCSQFDCLFCSPC